ncbi:MAG: hypothetical protein H7A55_10300 [Verrucomicrobiaceae bacterium]|nr:hypothetical protein [Verrucomicrobiaceae bacterium]
MKLPSLLLCLCLAMGHAGHAAAAEAPIVVKAAIPAKPPTPRAVLKPLPVRTYRDVLAVLPREMEPQNARGWSAAEKEVANIIMKKKLVDTARPAVMKLRVSDVSDWGRMILWATVENEEGYAIRVFSGAENPAMLPSLATLKPGDSIQLEGVMECVKFEQLWGGASLSICVRDGKVTKLLPNGLPAPKPTAVKLSVVSAVYGAGNSFSDVTDRVQAILKEPGAVFAAKPHWLGAEPVTDGNRTLIVVHLIGAKRYVFTVGEGGAVSADLLAQSAH